MARLPLPHGESIDYTLSVPMGESDTLVLYLHGFASHQRGEKALYFRDRFVEHGLAYLAFDFRGHGASDGAIRNMTLTRCLEDLTAVLSGPARGFRRIILIGSSMGGQVGAWGALQAPDRIAANLLIAPSLSFYENRMRELGRRGREDLRRRGEVRIRNPWVDVVVGQALIEDARRYRMEALIPRYRTPTLIFHGTADSSVPYQGSLAFLQKAEAKPLALVLIQGGDHRLTAEKAFLYGAMQGFIEGLPRS